MCTCMLSLRTRHRKEEMSRELFLSPFKNILSYPKSWFEGSYALCRATQIEEQIDVLNTDYQTMKIDFKLKNVTRTIKPEWFNVKPDS